MSQTASKRLSEAPALKRQVFFAMEDIVHAGPIARFFGILLFVLIVVNAVLVLVHVQQGLPPIVYSVAFVIEAISTVIFGIEYGIRVWVADLVYPKKTPLRARLRYVFSLMGIVDLLSFLPGIFAWALPLSAPALNSVRIIRLVRLIKVTRYMRGLQSIGRVFQKRRHEIIASSMVLLLLTITASVIMYTVENPVQPTKFDSVLTGMYWAMTTITTTGYGDLVPITPMGRFVGFFIMVLSIAVVAIPAGIFSAGFVSEFREKPTRETNASDDSATIEEPGSTDAGAENEA